jgi:DNA polymerase III epsilon subunit-like protein
MIYISIDTETTGLNPETCQLLSFGAIVEDTEKKLPFDQIPKFHCAILRSERDILQGELFALNMNKDLIERITQYSIARNQDEKDELVQKTGMLFLREEEVVKAFFHFLIDSGAITPDFDYSKTVEIINGKTYPMLTTKMKPFHLNVAGKNFHSGDQAYIERLPRWKQVFRIRHRHIDPSVLFADWKNDESMPNLGTCKERANVDGIVTHDALEDAWDVVQLLRTQY